MTLHKLADNLKLIVLVNIEVSLHSLLARFHQVLGFHFEQDLEWESLQQSNFAPQIVAVVVDRNPDLHGKVGIGAVDLIQVKAVVHALLDAFRVVKVSFFDPVVHHCLDPAVFVQKEETHLASQELSDEEITLLLKVGNDVVFFLG